MKTFSWKKLIPHIAAVVLFVLVAVIYCQPSLEGKVVGGFDITQWKAMVQQMQHYKDIHGHFPLWNNSMFSGMPGFPVALEGHNPVNLSILQQLSILFLPKPISFFFLLCISMYFLGLVLRINPWVSILAALAYAYASFSAVLVIAGHETEIQAMGYIPFLLGSLLLLYEGKYIWGTALTAVFTQLLIAMNHLQISYYFVIIAGFMTISYLIQWIKNKQYKHLIIVGALIVVAAGAGVMTNATALLTTYDYSKETMRNGGLTLDASNHKAEKSKGLPLDYAFAYSYGPAETFTFVVPNIYGGSSIPLSQDGKFSETLGEKQLPQQLSQSIYSAVSAYWGDQPQTAGPVYLGAVMTFLFIFGIFYVRSKHKWWLLAVTVLAILMAWGKYFPSFNTFLFDHLPLYSKFRAPTMSLVIPQLTFPIMAMLCLQQLFYGSDDKAFIFKQFKKSLIATGVLVVLLVGMYASLSYRSENDTRLEAQLTQMAKGDASLGRSIISAAASERQSLFGQDLLRSIIFIVLAIALVFLYIKGRVKVVVALAGLGLLVFIDLITVDNRYLNHDSFHDVDEANAAFNPSPANQQISRDTSYYRVLNLAAGDTWSDAITSYFHNSVGGYSAAKLAIYQDLLNFQFNKEPMNIQVLDMLNTKYIIVADRQNNQVNAEQNPGALGPCWFVKAIQYVDGPAAAMQALDHFNARDTAIVESEFKNDIPSTIQHDSTGFIRLINNDNDLITYESTSSSSEFAVFSEIYYNRGWKAYIDDKETPIVKTNYLLRGLAIPAGKHQIRFEFKPAAYYTGEKLSLAGSSLIVLLLLGAIFLEYRSSAKKKTA